MQKVTESKTEEEVVKNFEPLQEIITNVQFGYDEGDYGEYVGTVPQSLDSPSMSPHSASLAPQCCCSLVISCTCFKQRQSVRCG